MSEELRNDQEVYPGFLQLSGFMAMNFITMSTPFDMLPSGRRRWPLAEKHLDFYDEYLAVMDLDAAYYMQTVETVFIRHALPRAR